MQSNFNSLEPLEVNWKLAKSTFKGVGSSLSRRLYQPLISRTTVSYSTHWDGKVTNSNHKVKTLFSYNHFFFGFKIAAKIMLLSVD